MNGQRPGGGPVSGRLAGIAAHPTDPNTIYAAAAGGGVWKTVDGGATWNPLTDNQSTLSMGAIAVAASNPLVVYAGTGEANNSADSNFGRGVLVSIDGGTSWTLRTNGGLFDRKTIAEIAVDPTDANIAYVAIAGGGSNGAGGNTGIWKTTDAGVSWANTTATIAPNATWSSVVLDPSTPSTVYAAAGAIFGAAQNGVYKSTTGGTTWSLLGGAPSGTARGRIVVAVATANPQVIYVSAQASTGSFGALASFMRSDDGGSTFTDLTATTPNYMGGQGWYDTTLIVDPADASVVYAGGAAGSNSLIRSTTSGASWTDISTGPSGGPHVDHHAVAFDASGRYLDGNDGGIYRLDDPVAITWTQLNGNLSTIQFQGLGLHPTDANVILAGSQDNGTSKFTGNLGWTLVEGGDGGPVKFSKTNVMRAYHQAPVGSFGSSNFFRRTDNGGTTWSGKVTGITDTSSNTQNFYSPFAVDPGNGDRVLYGARHVWETTNGGDAWIAVGTFAQNVDAIGLAASDANTIYASAAGNVFVTTDHGATWPQHNLPVAGTVSTIQVDPTNSQVAYATVRAFTTGGNVFRTINGGTTWTDISGDLPRVPTWSLQIDPTGGGGRLYVGNDIGVYNTVNGGTNWTRFGTGLPSAQVFEIELNSTLNILGAATHGRGAWEIQTTPAPGTTTVAVDALVGREGDTVTLRATVSPAGVNGMVQFLVNGSSIPGSSTYIPGTGAATQSYLITVTTGNYEIRATFTSADPLFTNSVGIGTLLVQPGPALTRVAPARGQPGQQSMNVAVTGSLTHFSPGLTAADLGAGVTVNSTIVTDATHATVNVTIAGGAAIGPRDVVLITGGEVARRASGFAVMPLSTTTQPLAYVLGRRGGTPNAGPQTVNVVDTSTNAIVATIPVGTGCFCTGYDSVAVTPDGALVYVPNELDNTVSVISTASNSVIATLAVGISPIGVVPSPDGTRVYVLNGYIASSGDSPTVSVIDTASNTITATIALGGGVIQARGIAIAPNGGRLYVSTYGSDSIKVIDTATNIVTATVPIPVPPPPSPNCGTNNINLPEGVDVTPDGSKVYVANFCSNTVSVISTASNTIVHTIGVPNQPNSARVTPDGSRVYVVGSSGVAVANTQTDTLVVGNVSGAGGGSTLEFTPDGSRAYTASSSLVQVVNTATTAVIGNIALTTAANGSAMAIGMTPGPTRVASLGGNLAFGGVRVKSTTTRTLTISNAGNSVMTVSSIALPPGFSGNWTGGTIAPRSAQSVVVTFAPILAKSYGGIISVTADQTDGATSIAVAGVGVLPAGDFDGDGRSDITIFRPSTGQWFVRQSSTFTPLTLLWGGGADKPVPGDYDGDGVIDVAIFRPSTGEWFIRQSSTFTLLTIAWGGGSDIPVPADYDGDGKMDVAIFRPSTGEWFIRQSSTFTLATVVWGGGTDIPVQADYDGDGQADVAIFRPSTGEWFVRQSTTFTVVTLVWGGGSDKPVIGDYDGDGKADVAVFRPSTGEWFIRRSSTFTLQTIVWGGGDDIPVPGDYDGDGQLDVAIFRPATGQWFIRQSSTFTLLTIVWGGGADIPINKRP